MSYANLIKLIITCLPVFISNIAQSKPSSTNCEQNPIQCALLTLQPALGSEGSYLLSNLIHKYANFHNVDPYRLVAIAMQESSLRNINRTTKTGIITDVGLFQFNINTIDIYNMDVRRLQEDIAYAVERASWLLAKKLIECNNLGQEAWTCYHSRTDKHRLKYLNQVNKYYNIIQPKQEYVRREN